MNAANESINQASAQRFDQFKSFIADREEKRKQQSLAREQRYTATLEKLTSGGLKKTVNTEMKRRRDDLKKSQQAPLEMFDSIESPLADDTKIQGRIVVELQGRTTVAENVVDTAPIVERTSKAQNDIDITLSGSTDIGKKKGIFAMDVNVEEVPLLKSAMKTQSPKEEDKSILARVSSVFSGQKKKRRASFGPSEVKMYTPDPEEKKAMHDPHDSDQEIQVVVYDMRVYQSWRGYHDGEFIRHFNNTWERLADLPDIAKQTLHAARVMNLIHLLDPQKLRSLCLKAFKQYKNSFPRLTDKKGNNQISRFLAYLEKKLDAHVAKVWELEPDQQNPQWVLWDVVSNRERSYKENEYDYIADSPPTASA